MSKFVIFAVLLTFIVCLAVVAESQPQHLTANNIIQRIISQYESAHRGPSVVHPEQPAHVIDANYLHLLHI
ncbi:uncharacterized protein ACRADG_010290 [Cochliomyia hominivorax]